MQSLSSDWVDTQVDISFHWSYIPHCWFGRGTVKFGLTKYVRHVGIKNLVDKLASSRDNLYSVVPTRHEIIIYLVSM